MKIFAKTAEGAADQVSNEYGYLATSSSHIMRTDLSRVALLMNNGTVFDGRRHFADIEALQKESAWRVSRISNTVLHLDSVANPQQATILLQLDAEKNEINVFTKNQPEPWTDTTRFTIPLEESKAQYLDFYIELSDTPDEQAIPYLYFDFGGCNLAIKQESEGVTFDLWDAKQDNMLFEQCIYSEDLAPVEPDEPDFDAANPLR
jgi:hypothetical protein